MGHLQWRSLLLFERKCSLAFLAEPSLLDGSERDFVAIEENETREAEAEECVR